MGEKLTTKQAPGACWLIERAGMWWSAKPYTRWEIQQAIDPELHRQHWTSNPHEALRFSRREDAEALIRYEGWQNTAATEHSFIEAGRKGGGEVSTKIEVSAFGPVGCGKSAVLGEIEIALRAIGVSVEWEDPVSAKSEKNLSHADWISDLEMYKPAIVLREVIARTEDLRTQLTAAQEENARLKQERAEVYEIGLRQAKTITEADAELAKVTGLLRNVVDVWSKLMPIDRRCTCWKCEAVNPAHAYLNPSPKPSEGEALIHEGAN